MLLNDTCGHGYRPNGQFSAITLNYAPQSQNTPALHIKQWRESRNDGDREQKELPIYVMACTRPRVDPPMPVGGKWRCMRQAGRAESRARWRIMIGAGASLQNAAWSCFS
jgi:hypothetical protein